MNELHKLAVNGGKLFFLRNFVLRGSPFIRTHFIHGPSPLMIPISLLGPVYGLRWKINFCRTVLRIRQEGRMVSG